MGDKKSDISPRKCLVPECSGLVYSRGLCYEDYQWMATQVRRGKFLWSDFEKAGKCLPVRETRFNSKKAEWMTGGVESTADGTPPPKNEKKSSERPVEKDQETPPDDKECISCGAAAVVVVDGLRFCGKCAPKAVA